MCLMLIGVKAESGICCAGGPRGGGFTHLADIEAQQDPSTELLALIKSQKWVIRLISTAPAACTS